MPMWDKYKVAQAEYTDIPASSLFAIGEYYPHPVHQKRIERYKENRKLFAGEHYDVFERVGQRLSKTQRDVVYVSVNLAGLVSKKSADFLFGETASYSAGGKDDSPEQKALERIARDNDLTILNYESALGNSYRGDSFYKVRWGQRYNGRIKDTRLDPFRLFIDHQNAEYVFPEPDPTNANQIIAYHIAFPVLAGSNSYGEDWVLNVESHYPGTIVYRQFRMKPETLGADNEITSWKIYSEISAAARQVQTGIAFPLVVHVPNYGTGETWEGIDDLSELKPMLAELNNRLSLLAVILDKHSDPAIAVPAGSMEDGEDGRPIFHVGRDKVFEVMDKNEVIPQYITWDGQAQACFEEIKYLTEQILTTAEIPAVALGKDNAGTSGASGLSIKFRMNSLLSKINRKRQYYDRALRKVLLIAQLLEESKVDIPYKVTDPIIKFKDGLPDDETEMATIMSVRLGGKPTISQKTAIMLMDDLTEEQAAMELMRMQEEEAATAAVDSSIFNEPNAVDGSGEADG